MLNGTVAAASMKQRSTGINIGFSLPQTTFVLPSLEKAFAYSRRAYEILLESQQEIIQTLPSQFPRAASQKLSQSWRRLPKSRPDKETMGSVKRGFFTLAQRRCRLNNDPGLTFLLMRTGAQNLFA
jgi:hypothetical protein